MENNPVFEVSDAFKPKNGVKFFHDKVVLDGGKYKPPVSKKKKVIQHKRVDHHLEDLKKIELREVVEEPVKHETSVV